MKTIMKLTTILGLCAIMAVGISCNSTERASITAALPDMQQKSDGVYRGNYDLAGTPVTVTVDVTVQDQTITAITMVKHSCSPIGKKAEKITGTIIAEQSLAIDAVSGATGSSMAILKAVENALE
jgi:uncharacterized protein with FMN-binding domain